ncbi:MAG: DUF6152 family protein [Vicinamibacterales bacterium]
MTRRLLGIVAFIGLTAIAVPTFAHHALHAVYDTSKRVTFTGTLTKVAMINPHVRWFFDEKKPDGTVVKWEVSGAGAGVLRNAGLSRAWKVGDTYTVVLAPARDGSPLGRVVTFTFPDGKVVTLFHEDPKSPFNQ